MATTRFFVQMEVKIAHPDGASIGSLLVQNRIYELLRADTEGAQPKYFELSDFEITQISKRKRS